MEYTCEDGQNHYKTTFAIFGFQYILVETDTPFDPADFTVTVPANCTALVLLPDGSEREQTAGVETYFISEG